MTNENFQTQETVQDAAETENNISLEILITVKTQNIFGKVIEMQFSSLEEAQEYAKTIVR